jgi:hypothetical protein
MTPLDYDCNVVPIYPGDLCIIATVPPTWVVAGTGLSIGSAIVAQPLPPCANGPNSAPICIWEGDTDWGWYCITADGFELLRVQPQRKDLLEKIEELTE